MPSSSKRSQRPLEIIVRGDPIDVSPLPHSPAQWRALCFFEDNPDRRFYWETATTAQVRRMNVASLAFSASSDHGRYPVGRRLVEVHGRGPHALLFYRDWHAQRVLAGAQNVPPGCMILPHLPADCWGQTDEQQELTGLIWWMAWEMCGQPPTLGPAFDRSGDGENSVRGTALQLALHDGGEPFRSVVGHLTGKW